MAALDAAIQGRECGRANWMAGSSPAMTFKN
jgi:hypothetical protein